MNMPADGLPPIDEASGWVGWADATHARLAERMADATDADEVAELAEVAAEVMALRTRAARVYRRLANR